MNKLFVVTFYMLIISVINARAQNAFISIGGANETAISKLAINDVIGADNRIGYAASFDINLASGDNVKAILSELQSCASGNKKLDITISRANFNFELEETRQYLSAAVEQVILSEIDASSKSAAKISVEIKSTEMRLTKGGGQIKSPTVGKSKIAVASNYQFTLGSLPTRRVSKISALNIGNSNGQPKDFSIELSAADAKEWYSWLQKNGTGNSQKEQGTLSLLGPDMKENLFTINISDVRITSYSFEATASGAGAGRPDIRETIATVTIGLKAGSVLFNSIK